MINTPERLVFSMSTAVPMHENRGLITLSAHPVTKLRLQCGGSEQTAAMLRLSVTQRSARMQDAATATAKSKEIEEAAEEESVERATKLAPKLIYEVIRRDGEEELTRPMSGIFWSGISAGLLISLSVLGEAIFRTYLPDASWSYLIENLGYSLGFLVVILGRMQLFTENTITTVLPVMADPCRRNYVATLRVWSVVLLANVIGAFAISALFVFTPAISPEIQPAIKSLSEHATGFEPSVAFFRAIPAGILVAAIV